MVLFLEKCLNVIADFILKSSKNKVNKVLNNEEYKTEFDALAPIMVDTYKTVKYWHGSGRYHYKLIGDSKYQGVSCDVEDILADVLKNGLRTFHDPFIKFSSTYQASVSVAHSRVYACGYAKFHQEQCHELLFEYGSSFFWFWYFFLSTIFQKPSPLNNFLHLTRSNRDSDIIENGRVWISTIRKDFKNNSWSIFKLLQSLRSDIHGNYGIIFGIGPSDFQELDMRTTIWGKTEARITQDIKPNLITHIEVPLDHYKETKDILKSLGSDLSVFPIEFGEIICSQKKVEELVA